MFVKENLLLNGYNPLSIFNLATMSVDEDYIKENSNWGG